MTEMVPLAKAYSQLRKTDKEGGLEQLLFWYTKKNLESFYIWVQTQCENTSSSQAPGGITEQMGKETGQSYWYR